ncbi:MAG TPA: ATP-binding protein [Rhodocyclaceae bacterium]
MIVTFVLAASLLLQFLAAYFALRLIKVTGRSLAWSLIAAAITLMAIRRGISLAEILASGSAARQDLPVELIALAISVLMALGIERIAPIFKGLKATTDQLREREAEVLALNQALEQRVQERTAQLQQAYQELESFSYSVSHDLRAPLRALDGFSQLLSHECDATLGEEARRDLDGIRRNVARMSDMIDDILEFSRMSRREIEAGPVDMEALAREVFEEARSAVPGRAIELRLGALPAVRGDRAMLRQVFANLIGNAVKFTARRAAAVIEIDAETSGEVVTYCVKDNGAGFDMRYADKLFGVFQRLHSASEFEGSGLGLAIARRIVERPGGTMRAEGTPDDGARIWFTLPARETQSTLLGAAA